MARSHEVSQPSLQDGALRTLAHKIFLSKEAPFHGMQGFDDAGKIVQGRQKNAVSRSLGPVTGSLVTPISAWDGSYVHPHDLTLQLTAPSGKLEIVLEIDPPIGQSPLDPTPTRVTASVSTVDAKPNQTQHERALAVIAEAEEDPDPVAKPLLWRLRQFAEGLHEKDFDPDHHNVLDVNDSQSRALTEGLSRLFEVF